MSNSREIMGRKMLAAYAFASLSESINYAIEAVDDFNYISGDLNLGKQQKSFTPPHKKQRRSKFKRAGR